MVLDVQQDRLQTTAKKKKTPFPEKLLHYLASGMCNYSCKLV